MTAGHLAALLALAASAAAAPSPIVVRQADGATSSNVTLTPVTAPNTVNALTPGVNVTLPYGLDTADQSVVNVSLTTTSASVLLESISSVTSVDCNADSVSVTFDTADDLTSAYSQWSSHPSLVLVTNHMGDCDSEIERGFFTADSYTIDTDSLLLVATTQKSSITDIASILTADFSKLPYSSTPLARKPKRGLGTITYEPDPVNFNTSLVLNDTSIYENDAFTATLDTLGLDLSVTVGAKIVYNVLTSTLVELEAYLETNTTSSLVLDLDFSLPYNETFSYTKDFKPLIVNIASVLTFGPKISFGVGASVEADAGVDVLIDIDSSIYNGSVILDYTGNVTVVGDWEPSIDVGVTISESAGVSVTPFISYSFELDFDILNGTHKASGGIAPSSDFPTTIALSAEQEIGSGSGETATITGAGDAVCEDGLELVSNFDFALDAWITGEWDKEAVYNKTIPVLDKCLSF